MGIYRFRLEAQDGSGHFRSGVIEEESKERARLVLEDRERRNALFQLPAERISELTGVPVPTPRKGESADEFAARREAFRAALDDLPAAAPIDATEDEKAEFRALPVRDRSHLNLHRQTKPYKLVKLEAVT